MKKIRDKQFLRAGITGKLTGGDAPGKHYFAKTGKYALAGSTYSISYMSSSNGIDIDDMLKDTEPLIKRFREIVLNFVGSKFKHDFTETVSTQDILTAEVHPKHKDGILIKLQNESFCLDPRYLKALNYMEDTVKVEYSKTGYIDSPLRFSCKGKKFIVMPIRIQ